MTWYQIVFLPIINIVMWLEDRPRKNQWIESISYFERRSPKNAWLRDVIDQARLCVKYHMMPKTLHVRDDEAA